nr:MAG TPA: hypothetical protein [Caudoviricetes sp.]
MGGLVGRWGGDLSNPYPVTDMGQSQDHTQGS